VSENRREALAEESLELKAKRLGIVLKPSREAIAQDKELQKWLKDTKEERARKREEAELLKFMHNRTW
jgi:hypothetical protein